MIHGNRPLKFKMPILTNGVFTEWFYWGFIGGQFITPHIFYRTCPSFQYTGFNDKYGKEIYDGDVICFWQYYYVPSYAGERELITKIVQCDSSGEWNVSRWIIHDIEVIDNIYETPERLNETT